MSKTDIETLSELISEKFLVQCTTTDESNIIVSSIQSHELGVDIAEFVQEYGFKTDIDKMDQSGTMNLIVYSND